jgi:hypothetical protein
VPAQVGDDRYTVAVEKGHSLRAGL